MAEKPVTFRTPDGLLLEGLFQKGESGGIVICHPHPLYGGDMYNNVVEALQGEFSRRGFSTLRFNFRGVGGSEGVHGGGEAEREDLKGAIEFLSGEGPLWLAGYSFGAGVATQVIQGDGRIGGFICVSPPVQMYDFSPLQGFGGPKLLVAGDSDFVCPLRELQELFSSLPEPKALRVVSGADHFWWGREGELGRICGEFLEAHASDAR